ncbi:hypothetical protein DPMN_064982 [Dreissena polymorpha]|uniref:Uncharacterized protein n=1 Tax=Dreissena polymorpha TaxID=45954 RepID=A0A9D4CD89_DREPO|nr:hypothetical protein DPMN_064982 [Dreissena polymorpha]
MIDQTMDRGETTSPNLFEHGPCWCVLNIEIGIRLRIDSKVNSKKGITSTRCLNSKRSDNVIGKCKHMMNVLSQTDVYTGPGAKPNRAPVHVADLSQDQQDLLASHIYSQQEHKATMTEPAMTILTAEEVAGYVCINHVGKKLDVFERKHDSFESVIRSVETQLRIFVSREVAFLEAVPIVDKLVVMKACLRQFFCRRWGGFASRDDRYTSRDRLSVEGAVEGGVVVRDGTGRDGTGGRNGRNGLSAEGAVVCRNGLSAGSGVVGRNGRNGRNCLSAEGSGVVGRNVLSAEGAVVCRNGRNGRDGVSAGSGVVERNGLSAGSGVVGRNGRDGRDGRNGRDGLSAGSGVVGINGRNGRDGLSAGGGVVGRDGLSTGKGVVGVGVVVLGSNGRNGRDGRDGRNGRDGENCMSLGGGVAMSWKINDDIRWGVRSGSGLANQDVVSNSRLFDNHVGYGERDRKLNSAFIVYDDDTDDDFGGNRVVSDSNRLTIFN